MDKDLQIKMQELNEERLRIRILRRIPIFLIAIPFVGFFISSLGIVPGVETLINIAFFIPFIGIPIFLFIFQPKIKEFGKKYKEQIIKSVFSKYLDEFDYAPNDGISKSYINHLNIISTGDIYSSEDKITGKIKGVDFVRADVHIQDEYEDSEGHTSRTTVFEGQWMIFQFPKRFKSEVQVYSKFFTGSKSKSGLFSKLFKEKDDNIRHSISTESEEFNKKFKIYASDDHTAFYVLTPQILEAIIQLENKFGCKIMLLFTDNTLNIALRTGKNSLEPSYKKDMNIALEQTVKETEKEMQTLVDFVEYLKLTDDLFI